MRPIKLVLENFGPYRDRAEVDFSGLGEFFLICGKTGSGKSTIFDAITYALFGQAPGARSGFESELVSDFALPGEKPFVGFEFSLSGVRYKAERIAPYSRPRRGGGLSAVPPEAALYKAASGAAGEWSVVASGVRDSTAMMEKLVGLTADEFSKIILLPQGAFQRFLEMDSGERSKVLEKLFPVDLYERITEVAKLRTQAAQAGLAALESDLSRISEELGEEPEARSASMKAELESALSGETAALGTLAERERSLERERERAERADRARAAAGRLAALEARAPAEEERAARVAGARAAASVLPVALSFEKAKAKALDLKSRAAGLDEKLGSLEADRERIEAKRARAAECAALISVKQKELFSLQKAVATWKRRTEALGRCEAAGALAADLEARVARLAGEILGEEGEIAALRPKPEEEAALRSDLEGFQAAAAGLEKLSGLVKRRLQLLTDLEKNETSRGSYAAALEKSRRAESAAAIALADCEALAARGEAVRLAAALLPGEPCPVCGSREHPAPATLLGSSSPGGSGSAGGAGRPPTPSELEAARERRLKASGDLAAHSASLAHASERHEEILGALRSLDAEISEAKAALDVPRESRGFSIEDEGGGDSVAAALSLSRALSAAGGDLALLIAGRREALEGVLGRRGEAASREEALGEKRSELEAARLRAENARAELVAARTVLAEAERESGKEDPGPLLSGVERSIEALGIEKAGLEKDSSGWEEDVATTRATHGTLKSELGSALGSLRVEFARLAEALAEAGFLSATEAAGAGDSPMEVLLGEGGRAGAAAKAAASAAMPAAALAAEEKEAADYREALAAARAQASSLSADLPPSGEAMPGMAALEASVGEARASLAAARSRSDSLRLSIGRQDEALARRSSLEKRRDELSEGSRVLYRLSELFQGKISGKRLPFKNFVLAMYFREVIARASIHLSRMSDGRYYLKPEEGQASGNAKIGLGLRVLDSWTGVDRPTGTLSGGEKFLTSISLALGLADSIRERKGGVSLDSVFIDEGFGSLDDEALDRAIGVLEKIRGSRVIGIVSHVAGLRTRVPAGIEVVKTAEGSGIQSTMVSDQAL